MLFPITHEIQNRITNYKIQNDPEYGGFRILTIGPNSYIGGLKIDTAVDIVDMEKMYYSFQVGNYTAMADEIFCIIDIGHDPGAIALAPEGFAGKDYFINDTFRSNRKGQIIIENDCWIGRGVTILNGSTIHNGAIVGSGAVVAGDIPPYAIAVGNPARIVKYRFEQNVIDELQRIAWWNWDNDKLKESKADFDLPVEEFILKHKHEAWFNPEEGNNCETTFKPATDGSVPRFLFFVDYDEDRFALTDRVIDRFAETYRSMDAELILYYPCDSPLYPQIIQRLYDALGRYEDYDSVVSIFDDPAETDARLMGMADYYITNRSDHNIQRMNMAELMGVKCISGADSKPFSKLR